MERERRRESSRRFAEFKLERGPNYAWGKTARILTEPFLMAVINETDGDFVLVDLCSSYPIYKQIVIERNRERRQTQVAKLMGGFLNDLLRGSPEKQELESIREMDKENLARLREIIAPKRSIARNLLESALMDFVSSDPSEDLKDKERVKDILAQRFATSREGYVMITEPEGKHGDKGTWQFMMSTNTGFSLQEEFATFFGEDVAVSLINDLANYFAEKLAGSIRGFRVISLDIEDLGLITRRADRSFSSRFRNTYFFRNARKSGWHIRADVRSLPFSRDSTSFLSCIEGWPFVGKDFTDTEHLAIATQIADILKMGGRAVIFPWMVQGGNNKEILEKIEAFWGSNGLDVEKVQYTLSQLESDVMASREYDLVNRSPVFSEDVESFTLIAIKKPKK